ncbi:hypothetical protein D7030_01555 [Flavobacteriaceae bacterium AU392]|nr:hypothetical protein D1817_08010 [Flavobacteriaceae bacterium]RKM86563.1 hypothetical protein D7030_01555 [Flavobacteriaceae bacterium AU392]
MKLIIFIGFFVFVIQLQAQISDFNHIDFHKADTKALTFRKENLKDLPKLAYKLTSDLDTDVEKFRAIYMWVTANIANDYNFFLKHKAKTLRYKEDSLKLEYWNEKFRKKLFKKLLKQQKTICTGYAYMVRELSKLANLNCQIVNGFGRVSATDIERFDTPNHSWNAVKLEGKWYLSDPTWASGLINADNGKFKFEYNDGYFLTHPKLFVKNHYPIDKKWMLLNENKAPLFEEFLENPVIYGAAYKKILYHNTPQKLYNEILKKEKVIFEYQLIAPVNISEVGLIIDNGFEGKTVKPKITLSDNNILTLEYQFDKKGLYDVHFFIGDDLISTYTFKVRS